MKRDEAFEIASRHNLAGEHRLVDCLVALGLLKLEEPRAKPDFSADLTVELQARGCQVSIRDIEAALKAAGLRIVDDGERG